MLTPKNIIVLGGGLSGLSYAHYLRNFLAASKKTGLISKITILEASDNVGGIIKSVSYDDGIVHELGPHQVMMTGVKSKNFLCLLEQLRLHDQVLMETLKDRGPRLIYNNGKMDKIPESLFSLFKKLPHSKDRLINAFLKDKRTPRIDLKEYEHNDPTLYEFAEYRFGRDAAENLMDPLIRNTANGDARRLSSLAFFKEIIEKEQVYGSFVAATLKPPIKKPEYDDYLASDILGSNLNANFTGSLTAIALKTGMHSVTERLCSSLLNTNQDNVMALYTQTKAKAVHFNNLEGDQLDESPVSVDVSTIDGDTISITADHVVSCIPSTQLLELLPDTMPSYLRSTFTDLDYIEHPPLATVSLEYRNASAMLKRPEWSIIAKNLRALLSHSKSDCDVHSFAFDSNAFKQQVDRDQDLIRVSATMGGAWFEQTFGTSFASKVSPSMIEDITLKSVDRVFGIKDEPHRISTHLSNIGTAQYYAGHLNRLDSVKERLTIDYKLPITLLGRSFDGLAISEQTYASRCAAWKLVKSML